MANSPSPGHEQVTLDSLSVQQLTAVKKQLDDEVEHLTSSYAQLSVAQAKFKECSRVLKAAPWVAAADGGILVPLTNSLYVRGTIRDPDRVLVDVGTGFYAGKKVERASEFYQEKMRELGANIQDLEAIVQGKTNNLRAVEGALRDKVTTGNQ
ncbi:hypothetical protein P8C59_003381 [Phyllachora maydis]|uniref:Prefoldin subunit 5 n=1 Tax=Phyllachora maydis TaxID=1825666 RepID=A0AAD9M967_9PEZI|nr:hypothetical protein P8C59_003381 [Phyllachora maydis]